MDTLFIWLTNAVCLDATSVLVYILIYIRSHIFLDKNYMPNSECVCLHVLSTK